MRTALINLESSVFSRRSRLLNMVRQSKQVP
jgi:hypothetical protein